MTEPHVDLKTRLRMAVAIVGTQSAAATRLGISQARLSNYVRGENAPGEDILRSLSQISGVRLQWLRTGELPVFEPDRPAGAERTLEQMTPGTLLNAVGARAQQDPAFYWRTVAYLRALGAPKDHAGSQVSGPPSDADKAADPAPKPPVPIVPHADLADLLEARRAEMIRVVARVAAGYPFRWEGQPFPPAIAERYLHAPGHAREAFAMEVDGASMEPDMPAGSMVVFGRETEPGPESRAGLAIYEDAAGNVKYTLKYVHRYENRVHLVPANKYLFKTEHVTPERFRHLYPVLTVFKPQPGARRP